MVFITEKQKKKLKYHVVQKPRLEKINNSAGFIGYRCRLPNQEVLQQMCEYMFVCIGIYEGTGVL